MEAVALRGLTFAYPKSEYNALSNVSFTVERGSFALVMGASAAGKSTLLSLLKKELAPFGTLSGDISVNGSVGFLSQNAEESIVCDRVRSELAFGIQNLGKSSEEIELLIAQAAAYFNLESKLDKEVSTLSGGEKQLVCLASIMLMQPDILVLDEPCARLDPVAAERFTNVIKKLHSDLKITVIMSEHSTDLLYSYADKAVLLENGACNFDGTPRGLFEYLKSTNNPMLKAVPASLRYENRELKLRKRAETDVTPDAALSAKKLWFAYNRGEDVLKGLTFSAYKGKINAIIGCNGCGKTTLLKVLSGVYKPYSGKVKRSGSVSMLTQSVKDLFTKDSCCEEVPFGELTDYLGISDIKDRHPYDLSGGQAQRLALAKALETGADIIILDEPALGLDVLLKEKLGLLLRELCTEGKTVVIVTHDLDFAGEWADYTSFMSEGRIAASGKSKALFSSLSLYTTSLARLTAGQAVSTEDLYDEGE